MFAGVDARRCRALAQTKAIEAALVACANAGGLSELRELNIACNAMGDAKPLTACLRAGKLPKIVRIYPNEDPVLMENHIQDFLQHVLFMFSRCF